MNRYDIATDRATLAIFASKQWAEGAITTRELAHALIARSIEILDALPSENHEEIRENSLTYGVVLDGGTGTFPVWFKSAHLALVYVESMGWACRFTITPCTSEPLMNLLWNDLGIQIPDNVTVHRNGPDFAFHGTGRIFYETGRALESDDVKPPIVDAFWWRAKAMPGGFFISAYTFSGRGGTLQGATFNLALEVATAARRLL